MNIKSVYSSHPEALRAVGEIKEQLSGLRANFILYFASSYYDAQSLASSMQEVFPEAVVVGCSTAGELTSGKMLTHSLVAMAFSEGVIQRVEIALASNLGKDTRAINKAVSGLEKALAHPLHSLDPDQYVGILLTDGLSGQEERVNDELGNLTNITFIGGSAGDDLRFEKTYLYAHGKVYSDAALLILLKPKAKFHFLKTQSFLPTDKVLKVTKLNEAKREILEFNHQPATVAYAKALGVAEEELDEHLFKNPLGLMFDPQTPFVRSPRMTENKSVLFYCAMKQNMSLTLLQSTDIIADTTAALQKAKQELEGISAIINFNCILRTLDLKGQDKTEAYGKLFTTIPTVGFSTYGENYIGFINQTATMLLLKE
ncbi:FIST N-terminal domain-containing protein [Rhodocytophaga aerolata]|uniref:FIST N-terminal domain-containing protein n=1 Tax=Rhodocytophaga aerolata TaxID=455078 RepID=A0ABT8RHU1_9BACT|nr:FIST N-terminal domain-containing protein [Rhodocytophaga aerolata]MDO1451534.1 FIST N-terminal domain-containing protein [Rhodocytophaga aerolata]